MKQLTVWLLVTAMGVLGGCDDKQSEKPIESNKPQAKGVIGLSVLTMTNPFFKEIADTMTDEAKKNGFEVIVTSGEKSPEEQYKQVRQFIVQKVSAIVLTPCNSAAVGTAIKEANAAGIPVFTADIACTAPDAKVITHIATDNYAGGREAAKAIMQALGNKGKVAVLDFPQVESVQLRTRGFKDELAEAKSPIEIVGHYDGRGATDVSFNVAQDVLTSNKDLAGIFAINDPSALGACAAVEKAGRSGKIAIVGFDGQIDGKQAIKKGQIYADPIQFPDQIGRTTVQTIIKYLKGQTVEKQILIPTKLYFKEDARKDPALK